MMFQARTYDDDYGRHALLNISAHEQLDIASLVSLDTATRLRTDYAGKHRQTVDSTRWMQSDGTMARWAHGMTEVIA
jgi:hypothetical protein